MSASDHLSDAQLRHLASRQNQPDGGYTVKAFGPNSGDDVGDAYMVGIPGHSRRHSEDVGASDIRAYTEEKKDLLSQDGYNLGGWEKDLDVSVAFPKSDPSSLRRAKTVAVRGNQEGVGEVGTEEGAYEYAGTLRNPNYKEGKPQREQAIRRSDMDWISPEDGPHVSSQGTSVPKDGSVTAVRRSQSPMTPPSRLTVRKRA